MSALVLGPQVDPVESGLDTNDYAYVKDPVNEFDLDGDGFCVAGHNPKKGKKHGGCRGGSGARRVGHVARAARNADPDAETLDGLLARRKREGIRALHANAQRLLEPLAVVNPLAPTLTFADGRTRARRDQAKYLSLIRAVGLLHQHQRPRQRTVRHGVEVVYIEATADDVAVADRLAPIIFGDRVGELAPQTRRLLGLLDVMVSHEAAATDSQREDIRFTRRQAREHTGWSDFALRRHLARLVDLELVAVERRGHAFTYSLLWHDGEITGYDARSDGDAMGVRGQRVRSESRSR